MASLNTMFKEKANTTFNNTVFTCAIIDRMNDQMKRLYEAAKTLKGIKGQSALARALNESPQTVKNWESRGISERGLVSAQAVIGCNANWVRDGAGEMRSNAPQDEDRAAIEKAVELLFIFGKCSPDDQDWILSAAKDRISVFGRGLERIAGNKS